LRPVIVTAGVCAAALASIPAAHADSVGDAMAPVLNSAGIGNNGPVSGAIAQMGQSICPMLVKPGGSLASNAAQISGHGGLAPPVAGFLASMAIQAECPGFMTSVANAPSREIGETWPRLIPWRWPALQIVTISPFLFCSTVCHM